MAGTCSGTNAFISDYLRVRNGNGRMMVTTHKNTTPTRSECLMYGLGDFLPNTAFGLTGSYLIHFYENMARFDSGSIAVILITARITQAFIDILVGIIVDRALSRAQPLKRFMTCALGPFVVCLFLCFLPGPSGHFIAVLSAGLFYIAVSVTSSFFIIPYSLLGNAITHDRGRRLLLVSARMAGAMSATMVLGIVMSFGGRLSNMAGMGNSYIIGVSIMCMLGFVFCMLTILSCRERVPFQVAHTDMKTVVMQVCNNREWIVSTSIISLFYINLAVSLGLCIYYCTDVIHKTPYIAGILLSLLGFGKFLGVCLSPLLSRQLGWKNTLYFGYVTFATFNCVFGMVGFSDWLLYGTFFISALAQGLVLPVMYTILAQSLDDSAWTLSCPATALAVNSFCSRISWALGGLLVTALLSLHHMQYNRELPVTFGFVLVPALVALLSIVSVRSFPWEKVRY
ncbi:hypothetical protein GLUCORHAEAF1_00410 [Komagataeibacter rhaeticus AF1]|nr:hypothetical protein GLUCORHAEAF1_00410 [Komagataeibacter rhaeticus AF1]